MMRRIMWPIDRSTNCFNYWSIIEVKLCWELLNQFMTMMMKTSRAFIMKPWRSFPNKWLLIIEWSKSIIVSPIKRHPRRSINRRRNYRRNSTIIHGSTWSARPSMHNNWSMISSTSYCLEGNKTSWFSRSNRIVIRDRSSLQSRANGDRQHFFPNHIVKGENLPHYQNIPLFSASTPSVIHLSILAGHQSSARRNVYCLASISIQMLCQSSWNQLLLLFGWIAQYDFV